MLGTRTDLAPRPDLILNLTSSRQYPGLRVAYMDTVAGTPASKGGQWSVLVRGSGEEPSGTDSAVEEIYRCAPRVTTLDGWRAPLCHASVDHGRCCDSS